ncbi:PREDICTED: cytoplasmic polyadenylation element-binding protein 1-like [Thamnophis sirtalis]|uniref:Cytoplasmic polyadenylation element-binding protein 1-like n=1 Tax=Thamnophis sirtalis TaxID=35019 RepID=A0A6I9Y124_9SAUR|nr:PREDICTED: cytoplasmic polyadenylation element-binding protein 1-like [Thamnophis sirtalis]
MVVRSSLRISPPLPFLPIGGITRDSLNGAGSRLDQEQAALAAVTSSTSGALSKQWPGASSWPSWNITDAPEDPFSIEREARLHKQAAAVNEATCTWSGQLPPRNYKNPVYSCKVFLGGVPWDITEAGLISTFRVFGSLRVEWPGKDSKHPRCPPKGYAYLVFESEKSVRALLQNCSRDLLSPSGLSEYYFKMSSRRMRCKEVRPASPRDANEINRFKSLLRRSEVARRRVHNIHVALSHLGAASFNNHSQLQQ